MEATLMAGCMLHQGSKAAVCRPSLTPHKEEKRTSPRSAFLSNMAVRPMSSVCPFLCLEMGRQDTSEKVDSEDQGLWGQRTSVLLLGWPQGMVTSVQGPNLPRKVSQDRLGPQPRWEGEVFSRRHLL